jgi:diguanylate cyclase (GGDEF)-like protein/PAS domain S-box-containing protein
MKWARPHLLVVFLVGAAWLTPLHDSLKNTLADMRLHWFSRQSTGNIVLVAIDSPSIESIGTWPWPRRLHAELIDKLESAGVTDIAFDVDFSSPSNPRDDEAFLQSLRKAGGSVILPVFTQKVEAGGNQHELHVNRPLPRFAENAWSALVNVTADRDGVVRRFSYGTAADGGVVPSMAAMLAHSGTVREGSFWIDYSIVSDSIPTVSYVDVLRGRPDVLQSLQGRKVVIGGTAIELGDRFTIPHGRIISGPMLQILAAESILQGRDLQRISGVLALPGIVLLGVCMVVLRRPTLSAQRAILLLIFGIAVELGAAYLQSRAPLIVDTSLFQVGVAGYLLFFTMDEIDFRGMLARIADRRFENVAMSLGEGLLCANREGRITMCNPAAAAIFGYDIDEMMGHPVEYLFDCSTGKASISKILRAEFPADAGHLVELSGLRKNGEIFPAEVCLSRWEGIDGIQYGFIVRDITVRKREAEKIRYLAEYDTLTGLANRHVLNQKLHAELTAAQTLGRKVGLLVLDLDSFKEINDTFGHTYGDRVLVAVAGQLKDLVAECGLVARLGGDEFAIVVSGGDSEDRTRGLAAKILVALGRSPIVVDGRQLWVNASVGMACYPDHGTMADELLSNADLALYRAKANGRGQSVMFEREFRESFEKRLLLEAELKRAAESGQFELFYQPQVDLRNGRLVGAEALIRWRHPTRGLVSPAEFMPIINTSSMANEVGNWVLVAACRQGSIWQKHGHHIRIGVNLSPSQLRSGDLATVVGDALKTTGLSPCLLELEVTEDIVLADEETALDNFRALQELGVKLAFDDFGTGYAGLSYLKKFPFNVLKIDKSFVAGLCTSSDDMTIVGATISMSKQFGLSVIAEGVEDRSTAEALRNLACEEGQGYLFGRAMPAAEFEDRFLAPREQIEPTRADTAHAA